MYKLLLCLRYLRTRWIALASIVSVMLGVATMILVNSVMAGFTHEMQNRIHGIISDIVFESRGMEGMPGAEGHMRKIQEVTGNAIEAMTPTVVVPGILNFQFGGQWRTHPVTIVGIDELTQGKVSDFAKYLQHPENRRQMSFQLRELDYDTVDHQMPGATERTQMKDAGWQHRRELARIQEFRREMFRKEQQTDGAAAKAAGPGNPFDARRPQPETVFDPAKEQHTGVVLGIAMASYRTPKGEDRFVVLPGDDVKLTLPTAGTPPTAAFDNFTVVDLYESKMSEYDSSFVFVPIHRLQEMRGMFDRASGARYVNSIMIKLKPGVNGEEVRDKLRAAFPPEHYGIFTWRDKQGALLAAVQMETAILNILLFFIIFVAGFGILAIFSMIVVEKTRDIGILKSLGASGRGVMGIFLSYGLSLGIVGSGVGMVLGLLSVRYINEFANVIGWITGRPPFDPQVYYFYKIPTIVYPHTVAWIVAGAISIAVLASIWPARRAAGMHPVEALRYE